MKSLTTLHTVITGSINSLIIVTVANYQRHRLPFSRTTVYCSSRHEGLQSDVSVIFINKHILRN